MMLKEASLQKIDKDSLRKLPLPQQKEIGIQAAKRMAMHLPQMTCIDTHAMIKTPIGYCPGIPEEVIRFTRDESLIKLENW